MEEGKISHLFNIITILKAINDKKAIEWYSNSDKGWFSVKIDEEWYDVESIEFSRNFQNKVIGNSRSLEQINELMFGLLYTEIQNEFGDAVSELKRSNSPSRVVDILYDWVNSYLKTFSKQELAENRNQILDNYLYAAGVTKIKLETSKQEPSVNPTRILEQIYGDIAPENENYVTRDGGARAIAEQLTGYRINKKGAIKTINDLFLAKMEAIDIINRLYEEIIRSGYLTPSDRPLTTQEKLKAISGNPLNNYISLIISKVNKMINLTFEARIAVVNDCLNPRVSLAILNHYIDGVNLQYDWKRGRSHIGTLQQEMALATSKRDRNLNKIITHIPIAQTYLSALSEIDNVTLPQENWKQLTGKISGLTYVKEGYMTIGDGLSAATAIGKVRENQEDAVLLLKDDIIPGFKMMVVADGMGGMDKGEVASHMVIEEFRKWFERLDYRMKSFFYEDIDRMQYLIKSKIQDISEKIKNNLKGKGGATIVCAVIGRTNTLIANAGDSRAYIFKGGKLVQVSVDDTVLRSPKDKDEKELSRFDKNAHIVTNGVGMNESPYIHSRVLDNTTYDRLFLTSDGVTDCLSDEQIAVIASSTDKKLLAQKMVAKALNTTSHVPPLGKGLNGYNQTIAGGKDNATVAVYVPDKKEKDTSR